MRTFVAIACLAAVGCSEAPSRQDAGQAQTAMGEAGPLVSVYVRLRGPGAVEAALERNTPAAQAKAGKQRLAELAELQRAMRGDLEARGGVVISEMRRLTNAIHVRLPRAEITRVRRLAHVIGVEAVPRWRKSLRVTLDVVGAPSAWQTTPYHGDGMKVAIVDSGIDYYHADFGGSGDPSDYQSDSPAVVESGSFPTARVVAGWDLAGNAYNPELGIETPTPDDDPLDCGGHGSLVGGVAVGSGVLADGSSYAGSYDQSFDFSTFRIAPGVAPRADIYAIKVFGCQGPTSLVGEAMEIAADPNGDGVFDDRIDVVNMSLGSDFGYHSITDAEQMRNLNALGVTVVAATGNGGQSYFVAGTPGGFPEPIAVGGLSSVPLTLRVDAPGSIAGDYLAVEGAFSAKIADVGAVTAAVVRTQPANACGGLRNAGAIAGNIALIDRGSCLFVEKFERAENAGAVGVIVINNEPGVFVMGGDDDSPLPGVMISTADGNTISAELGSGVTATLLPAVFEDGLNMWPVSSRGPSPVGNILRPDVSAPADGIASAEVGTGSEGAAASGTSFATPFVAGAAALLLQQRPELTPHEVKAVMMASATRVDADSADAPVSWQGAGLIDIPAMLDRTVTAAVEGDRGEVAVSFGAIVSDESESRSRDVVISNRGTDAVTYDVALDRGDALPGVTFAVTPVQVNVAAGSTATLTVSMEVDPAALGAPGPDPGTPEMQFDLPRHYINEAWGRVTLQDGGDQSIALPFHAVVRAAANRAVVPPAGCGLPTDGSLAIQLTGNSAHPSPVASAFELGAVDEEDPESATEPKIAAIDLRAVGAASNASQGVSYSDLQLDFGIAIEGEWSSPAGASVGIEVDVDGDGEADSLVLAHAYTLLGPYADVFASTTYRYASCANLLDITSCQPSENAVFANLVSRDEADTHPFLNSVIVVSSTAQDLGLRLDATSVRYRAVTFEQTEPYPTPYDDTEWIDYTFTAPSVDTASMAPTPGVALHTGDAMTFAIDATQPVSDVLVLHHTNVAGARWEVLDPATYAEQPAAIAIEDGDSITVTLRADTRLADVLVEGTLSAGTVTDVKASQGECVSDPLSCDLGEVAAGDSVTIELSTIGSGTASLSLVATSESGCESTATREVKLSSGSDLVIGGGCGCQVVGAPPRSPWLLALAAGVALSRRRRSTIA